MRPDGGTRAPGTPGADAPSGERVALAVRNWLAAHRVSVTAGLAAVSGDPHRWLSKLRRSRRPRPATLARINYLLAHPPGTPIRLDRPGAPTRRRRRVVVIADAAPGVPSPPLTIHNPPALPGEGERPRVDRDPCFACGVRGDIGCGCRMLMRLR